MQTNNLLVFIKIFFLLPFFTLRAMQDIQFYHPARHIRETRFEREWISSWDLWLGGGKSNRAHSQKSTKVPLFDIYGTHPMQLLGQGICKDSGNLFDTTLIKLALLPSVSQFATFSIDGTYTSVEGYCTFSQNFEKGFFLECCLPIKSLKIDSIVFNDLSSSDLYPNTHDPSWTFFKEHIDTIFETYGLSLAPWKDQGVGDVTLLVGWSMSYQDTKEIDFVDVTVLGGMLLPTAKKKSIDHAFSLPLGYNAHWGCPIAFSCAIGGYEWLTVGLTVETLFLFGKRDELIRMKSSAEQSSLLLLTTGHAHVYPGTLYSVAPFIKADHVIRGFSLTVGYTYARQKETTVTPFDQTLFPYAVVNSDKRFAGFTSHTLHAIAEYDFADQNWNYGPRIGLSYHHQLSGTYCFKTYLACLTAGLEIVWDV